MGVELLPVPLNDNLTIPVFSGTVMMASQGLL
jgi:dolichol kinase